MIFLKVLETPHNLTDQSQQAQPKRTNPFDLPGPNYGNIDSFSRSDSVNSGHDSSIIKQAPCNGATRLQPSRNRSVKTYRNRMSLCKLSPNSKSQMIKVVTNTFPAKNLKDLQEFFNKKKQ